MRKVSTNVSIAEPTIILVTTALCKQIRLTSPFPATPVGRPGEIQEEATRVAAPTVVATQATVAAVEKAAELYETNHAIIGTIKDAMPQAAGDPTPVGRVEGATPTQFAPGLASVQVCRMRPTHGISRAISYWRDALRDHPREHFRDRILGYVENGVKVGYVESVHLSGLGRRKTCYK